MSRKKRIILVGLALPLAAILLCALVAAVELLALPIEDGRGHDGRDISTAIVIHAQSEMEGADYEYLWLALHRPADAVLLQELIQAPGRTYDAITLLTPSGETETIYFDITSFFGKW
jgi:hypothetical protein